MHTLLTSMLMGLGLATFVAPCSAALFNHYTKSQESEIPAIELDVASSKETKQVKKYKPHQAQNYIYKDRSLGKGFAYLLGSFAALGSVVVAPYIAVVISGETGYGAIGLFVVGLPIAAVVFVPIAGYLLYKSIVFFRGKKVLVEEPIPATA